MIPEGAKTGISKFVPERLRPVAAKCYAVLRRAKTRVVAGFYHGSRYRCLFCGGNFRKLLPMGVPSEASLKYKIVPPGQRNNARCPRCGSLDRERHIELYLRNETDVYEGDRLRLLHFAPERNLGRSLKACPGIEYVSVDISMDAMTRMDLLSLGLADDAFDVVICSHVIEHVEDDRKALSELFRVLVPGGWGIIQAPISAMLEKTYEDSAITEPEERLRAFGQSDHLRLYGMDYGTRLQDVGFEVSSWAFRDKVSEADAQKHALLDDERIFICRKRLQRQDW